MNAVEMVELYRRKQVLEELVKKQVEEVARLRCSGQNIKAYHLQMELSNNIELLGELEVFFEERVVESVTLKRA